MVKVKKVGECAWSYSEKAKVVWVEAYRIETNNGILCLALKTKNVG
jgi:hypothetical protein